MDLKDKNSGQIWRARWRAFSSAAIKHKVKALLSRAFKEVWFSWLIVSAMKMIVSAVYLLSECQKGVRYVLELQYTSVPICSIMIICGLGSHLQSSTSLYVYCIMILL